MSRLLSVSLTEDAVLERRKTVTRRLGWWIDKNGRRLILPGQQLTLCRKVMGRRKGEPLVRLAQVEVTSVTRGPLWGGLSDEEATLEGFPEWSRLDFYLFFRDAMLPRMEDLEAQMTPVTRLEWRYLEEAPRA